jgi:maltooligosyltrehalose trehalohydrolase
MGRTLIGATFDQGHVTFLVWAPKCRHIDLVIQGRTYSLNEEENNYFSLDLDDIQPGTTYGYRLDQSERLYPDPASRFQPEGPHGPSQIIDRNAFKWTDQEFKGIDKKKAILYEMHIGTFTPEGTWKSAIEKLPFLVEIGITVIEMMPVNEFCGKFNWGYDGVSLFAPTHNYGHPDDLKAFINEAHKLGLGVILDVVYNHFGPDGNYLPLYSDHYLKKRETEWGRGINFDEEGNHGVRDYFTSNARYWIEEFHFDGFRFDACHAMQDSSETHILHAIQKAARGAAPHKTLYLIAENEQQQIRLVKHYGLDSIWNEDFHHTAYVRLTGHAEAYYKDYMGSAQEFVSGAKYGFLFQGQWYRHQKKRRGSYALDREPTCFVNFLENHDQVANSPGCQRLKTFSQAGSYRAMTALLLLSPQIPLLFQGQEFGTQSPFHYFSDQPGDLPEKIFEGRKEFMTQFESYDPSLIPLPGDEETFLQSKLDWKINEGILQMYKDLIRLRHHDPVFSNYKKLDGAIIAKDAFLLRFWGEEDERLVVFNFGIDHFFDPSPEPLIAPPFGQVWGVMWSSEATIYGGYGHRPIHKVGNWHITGRSAFIYKGVANEK